MAKFSKVTIIQSLQEGDSPTGRDLYEEIDNANSFYTRGLTIEFLNISEKSQLFSLLSRLETEAKKGLYPLIHIETHGSEDKTGLILSSGDYVSWKELKEPLTKINIASELNLLIILAACYGGYLASIIDPTDRAPCWGLIGPDDSVGSDFILKSFSEFYRTLLEKNDDGSIAIMKLIEKTAGTKVKYGIIRATDFFVRTYKRYYEEACSDAAIQKRASDLHAKQKTMINGYRYKTIDQITQELKEMQPHFFEQNKTHFFMYDIFPKNITRFNVRFEDLL